MITFTPLWQRSDCKDRYFPEYTGAPCRFLGLRRVTTGLMPKIAPQALKTCSPLEPDWLAKAAAKKLPHRGRAASAAFDRQAALRIPYIVRAEGRNESGKTNTKILAEDGQRLRPRSFLKDAKSSSATFGRHRINISPRQSRYTNHRAPGIYIF